MNVQLQLRYAETPVREPAAWFVGGATAEAWLRELVDWSDGSASARLVVVPVSRRNPTPCGALVLGAGPRDGKPSPSAVPYGVVAGRLYLPVEARIEPDLDDRELRALVDNLLDADDVLVWHPGAGLIATSKSAAPCAADLLAAELDDSPAWDAAVAGVALNARLTSIEPEIVPRAADVLEAGRSDIGSQPLDIEKLPPAPGEPPPSASGGAGQAIGKGMLKALQWLMPQAPQGGGGSGWMNSIQQWVASKLESFSEQLDFARQRELERLMNLLQNDPDQGLRFALPMGGGENRGVAPPSDRLDPRNVDFRLDNFRGGGPADVWDMPPDFQRDLIRRYRELAAREVALGRRRRAAYIFASLLGDFRAAANTLADGGHFREAAALYEERLNQPAEAARCLRQGGLWAEAIALYQRLGRHETVGDIHAELEQPDEAEAAFRKAVAVHLDASDTLAAAKLLEGKLKRPDEALEHLLAAWPRSKQGAASLTEGFALLARHGRHDEAVKLVDHLAAASRPPETTVLLTEILSQQARDYPHDALRAGAADQTRVVAADRLSAGRLPGGPTDEETGRLVAAVTALAPLDQLLRRDGRRFLDERRRRPERVSPPARRTDRLSVAREFWLPQLDWRTAVAGYEALYAAGFRDRELVVVRTDWNGADPQEPIGMKWEVEPSFVENPILLAADPLGSASPVVHVVGAPPLVNSRWFRTSDQFPEPSAVGPHRGVGQFTHAFCYSAREAFHTVELGNDVRLVVNGYFGDHAQLAGLVTIDFTELLDEDDAPPLSPLPMVVVDETVIVAIGRKLCFAQPHRKQQVVELPHPITRLSASPAQSRVRVFATMTQGAVMFWGNGPDAFQTPLASEMPDPCVTLARDGFVIAASKQEIDVYSAARGRLRLELRAVGPGWQPLAALAPRHVNRFALMAPDGRIVVYDLPST
jgi:tetratricopeptide (TPR) repeat protein